MGSLKLCTAVEGGSGHAQQLLDYHVRMFDASPERGGQGAVCKTVGFSKGIRAAFSLLPIV